MSLAINYVAKTVKMLIYELIKLLPKNLEIVFFLWPWLIHYPFQSKSLVSVRRCLVYCVQLTCLTRPFLLGSLTRRQLNSTRHSPLVSFGNYYGHALPLTNELTGYNLVS